MSNRWPTADLDPVRRLQIMASAIPGAMAGEVLVHRPIADVWARASDLETELPLLVHDFREVRVPGASALERAAAALMRRTLERFAGRVEAT